MPQSDLIVLARRGNADAIAHLISHSLAAQGITAEVEWQADTLHIWLRGQSMPPAKVLVPNLRQGFERLAINREIGAICVYAGRVGQDRPEWREAFSLNPILDDPVVPVETNLGGRDATDCISTGEESVVSLAAPSPLPPTPEVLRSDLEASSLPPDLAPMPLVADLEKGDAIINPAHTLREPISTGVVSQAAAPLLTDAALATLAHGVPLLGYLVWLSMAWIGVSDLWLGAFLLPWRMIVPLALVLTRGRESRFLRRNTQEALNFQISCTLYWLVTFALRFLLVGFLLVLPLACFEVICVIIAAVKASDSKVFRYPLRIRFVR